MSELPEILQAQKENILDVRTETIIARVDNPNQTECPSVDIAAELVRRWNAHKEFKELIKGALEGMDKESVQCTGEWQTGLFCGLEDRNITDRYEACMYGYEAALEKVQEWVLCGFEQAIAESEK